MPFALNADLLQFPFWAAMLFHGLRAFETRKPIHWVGLTLAFTAAFYAKYTVALLAVCLGVADPRQFPPIAASGATRGFIYRPPPARC